MTIVLLRYECRICLLLCKKMQINYRSMKLFEPLPEWKIIEIFPTTTKTLIQIIIIIISLQLYFWTSAVCCHLLTSCIWHLQSKVELRCARTLKFYCKCGWLIAKVKSWVLVTVFLKKAWYLRGFTVFFKIEPLSSKNIVNGLFFSRWLTLVLS